MPRSEKSPRRERYWITTSDVIVDLLAVFEKDPNALADLVGDVEDIPEEINFIEGDIINFKDERVGLIIKLEVVKVGMGEETGKVEVKVRLLEKSSGLL